MAGDEKANCLGHEEIAQSAAVDPGIACRDGGHRHRRSAEGKHKQHRQRGEHKHDVECGDSFGRRAVSSPGAIRRQRGEPHFAKWRQLHTDNERCPERLPCCLSHLCRRCRTAFKCCCRRNLEHAWGGDSFRKQQDRFPRIPVPIRPRRNGERIGMGLAWWRHTSKAPRRERRD